MNPTGQTTVKTSLKKDCLAFALLSRPGMACRDISQVPVPEVVQRMKKVLGMSNLISVVGVNSASVPMDVQGVPESDALMFYSMNHAVSLIRQSKHEYESLGEFLPVVNAYTELVAVMSVRVFYYLLLICTRESRHNGSSSWYWDTAKAKWGLEPKRLYDRMKGKGSLESADCIKQYPPDMTLGAYVDYMRHSFYNGDYGHSFGGKAWGQVTDCLHAFVHGKTSAEMMLDTAFTLAHNTAPIFNKGMLYCQQSKAAIKRILDVQRSGQIPQLIAEGQMAQVQHENVQAMYIMCRSVLKEKFTGYVDWFQVEALGGKETEGHYHNEQQAQIAKHGYPKSMPAKLVKKEPEPVAVVTVPGKNYVEIFPKVYIETFEVERE